MQCLKCSEEALPGKALCVSCFSRHERTARESASDEWIEQKLKATREGQKARASRHTQPSLKTELQNVFMRVAPMIIIVGGVSIWATWFYRNGGFSFGTAVSPNGSPFNSASISGTPAVDSELGTSGMAGVGNRAASGLEPPKEVGSGFGKPNSEAIPMDTATPTPTSTPTHTPTTTPTITPTLTISTDTQSEIPTPTAAPF